MSVGNKGRFALLFGFALGLMACTSKPVKQATCESRDWYELGRRDGAQGATMDRFPNYQKDCGDSFNADWETMYVNGRNAGLVEFCAPDNAYEMGRMGLTYQYVCPSTVEPAFLEAFRKGQNARNLQIKNKELDARIDSLTDELQRAQTEYEQRRLTSELEELRKRRAQITSELDRATN